MQFIPVIVKLNAQHHYPSHQSDDPSEIIPVCWFAAQEAFLIIISSKLFLILLLIIFVETVTVFSKILWWKKVPKNSIFIG